MPWHHCLASWWGITWMGGSARRPATTLRRARLVTYGVYLIAQAWRAPAPDERDQRRGDAEQRRREPGGVPEQANAGARRGCPRSPAPEGRTGRISGGSSAPTNTPPHTTFLADQSTATRAPMTRSATPVMRSGRPHRPANAPGVTNRRRSHHHPVCGSLRPTARGLVWRSWPVSPARWAMVPSTARRARFTVSASRAKSAATVGLLRTRRGGRRGGGASSARTCARPSARVAL
jgi:hypothetical protein